MGGFQCGRVCITIGNRASDEGKETMDFVAIDFETANYNMNSACSVAVVEAQGGKLRDAYYSLIKPPGEFYARNIEIHGITPDMVRDQPSFAQIWDALRPYLEGRVVIAHNASFDMGVLRGALAEYRLAAPQFQHLCTVRIARKVWPALANHKLDTLGRYFRIPFRHHDALEDARVCAEIALRAETAVGVSSLLALSERLRVPAKPFLGQKP